MGVMCVTCRFSPRFCACMLAEQPGDGQPGETGDILVWPLGMRECRSLHSSFYVLCLIFKRRPDGNGIGNGMQERAPWMDVALGARAARGWACSGGVDSELLCRRGADPGLTACEAQATRRGWVGLPRAWRKDLKEGQVARHPLLPLVLSSGRGQRQAAQGSPKEAITALL
jgi:hypothetical protein